MLPAPPPSGRVGDRRGSIHRGIPRRRSRDVEPGSVSTHVSSRHMLKVGAAASVHAARRKEIQASVQDFGAVTGERYVRRPQNATRTPFPCRGRVARLLPPLGEGWVGGLLPHP